MIRLIILLILIVAFSGCTGDVPENDTASVNSVSTPSKDPAEVFPVIEPGTVYVNIKGTMFNPSVLDITKGTTVKWNNQDSGKYIINISGSISPPMNKKETWSYTFNTTGTYEYTSDLHPFMPHGRINVI